MTPYGPAIRLTQVESARFGATFPHHGCGSFPIHHHLEIKNRCPGERTAVNFVIKTTTTNEPDEKLNRQNQQGTNPVATHTEGPNAEGPALCAKLI